MKIDKTASRQRRPFHTVIPHRELDIESLYTLHENVVYWDLWTKALVIRLGDVPADAEGNTHHDYYIRLFIADHGVCFKEIANACSAADERLTPEQVGAWVPDILKILFHAYGHPPHLVDEVLARDA